MSILGLIAIGLLTLLFTVFSRATSYALERSLKGTIFHGMVAVVVVLGFWRTFVLLEVWLFGSAYFDVVLPKHFLFAGLAAILGGTLGVCLSSYFWPKYRRAIPSNSSIAYISPELAEERLRRSSGGNGSYQAVHRLESGDLDGFDDNP